MDRFFKDFSRNFLAIFHLPEALRKRRNKILLTYIRLSLKLVFINKLLRINIASENIFGIKMNFLSYFHFVRLFEETYIRNEYYFQTKNKTPLIIDCGSNIDTPIYFKWLYPNAKIISFEPNPISFELVKKNVEENNFKDIKLNNLAVWDKNSTLSFYSNKEDVGTGLASVFKSNSPVRKSVNHQYKVESKKLSEFIGSTPVDLLKIDIEGAENVVLKELVVSGKLKKVDQLIIEYHHHLSVDEDKLGDFLATLEKNDFHYQLETGLKPPFNKGSFQDLIIYAYK